MLCAQLTKAWHSNDNKVMKTKLITLAMLFVSATAHANVIAMPSYFDFGPVKSGQVSTASITFMNMSNQPIPFFNVFCSGDMSAFMCNSNCFQLPAHGSCFVQVYFTPRNGDGLRRWISIHGNGPGVFATADVYGTDFKSDIR